MRLVKRNIGTVTGASGSDDTTRAKLQTRTPKSSKLPSCAGESWCEALSSSGAPGRYSPVITLPFWYSGIYWLTLSSYHNDFRCSSISCIWSSAWVTGRYIQIIFEALKLVLLRSLFLCGGVKLEEQVDGFFVVLIWMLHTVTVASKTQKFFLNAGWRVMPEDEKIKLVQESEAIGQVLQKIRWGRELFVFQVFYILGNWSWLKNRYLDNCQSLSNKDCQVWSNWYFQTWRNELFD